jgi:hypothetical protein
MNTLAEPGPLSNLDVARVAAAILVSVAASVWLINKGGPSLGLLRWLVIMIAVGLIANSQTGMPLRRLLLACVLCSAALVAGVVFQALIICDSGNALAPALITGINLCARSTGFNASLFTLIFISSVAAMTLAALARPVLLDVIKRLPNIATKARKFERAFRTIVLTIIAIYVSLTYLAKA